MPSIKAGMDVKVMDNGKKSFTIPGVRRQARIAPMAFPAMNEISVATVSRPSVQGRARNTRSSTWLGKLAREGPRLKVAIFAI
jgi:hypothetical protein